MIVFRKIFKWTVSFVVVLFAVAHPVAGQRFTFIPEMGYACSQIDGDWLQGFNKGALSFGIGSHYYVNDVFQMGFAAKYMQLGSETSGSRQNRPPDAFQFTASFTAANLGAEIILAPFTPQFKLGAGINLNRVFNFQYRSLVKLSSSSEFQINNEELKTSFIGYTFAAHIKLYPKTYFKISFSKAFSSLLDTAASVERSSSIRTLTPYYLCYSVFYEFDPNPSRNSKRKKERIK